MARLAQKDEQLIAKYLSEVNALAPSLRQELAQRILPSLKEKPAAEKEPKSLLDFAGIWNDDADAERIAEDIRNSRNSRPKPDLFQ